GMSRYNTASAANRLALVGAVLLATVVLAGAVLMTVWNRATEPPAAAPGPAVAAAKEPAKPAKVEPPGEPEVVAPPPTEKTTEPDTTGTEKVPEKPPVEDLGGRVPAPNANRDEVGKVETPNVLVLTRGGDAAEWVRVDAAEPVSTQDEILCLPGYKADVGLTKAKLTVHMWGNLPELLGATGPGVRVPLECRLRLHPPPAGFDADFTLLGGRVYVSTKNPDGAKVRVRLADEVWDVRLKDPKTDVMVELVSAYLPGTPFAKEGGEKPRAVARMATTRGAAEFEAVKRFKKPAELAEGSFVAWDSTSGQLAEPRPIDPNDVSFRRFLDTFLPAKHAETVNTSLAALVKDVDDPKKVRLAIFQELDKPADRDPVRQGTYRVAVFALAAVMSDPAGKDGLRALVDVLGSETRGYGRSAAADALSLWLARDPQNTARMYPVLLDKGAPPEEAELILRLLRGYTRTRKPDPADLDTLVTMLTAKSLRVRELALWNLMNFVDPSAAAVPALFTDVALDAQENGYEKFVAAWKARIEEVKKQKDAPPPEKKEPAAKDTEKK
ncbi:MAG: hypothetical protein K2P78_04725, partial [Gemmataceae bacterium]|nr:hypothetical protein [Gemmataceae bacterium]